MHLRGQVKVTQLDYIMRAVGWALCTCVRACVCVCSLLVRMICVLSHTNTCNPALTDHCSHHYSVSISSVVMVTFIKTGFVLFSL